MLIQLGNNPISYDIPVKEVITEVTPLNVLTGSVVMVMLVFFIIDTLMDSNSNSTVVKIIGYSIAGLISLPIIGTSVYAVVTDVEMKPSVSYETSDKDISESIERNYRITVDDLDGKLLDSGWEFTALTDQGRYKCDAVVLKSDRYTVYCNEQKGRVSLDSLLDRDS